MIGIEQLIAAGITPTLARAFAEPLSVACERFAIDSPRRIAMFVAQASHESQGFARLEESLYYTTALRLTYVWPTRFTGLADAGRFVRKPQALANHVYAGRNGNGDENSGDGWRFRGRGLFQLTGRANYLAAEDALVYPYVEQPEMVTLPAHAALTAAWYWTANRLNDAADVGDVRAATRLINGPALVGLSDRREAYDEALSAFT